MGWFGAIVIGAVVGAIIGAFSVAISGGDIKQGVLFGALAGAVTGGFGYAFTELGSVGSMSATAGDAYAADIAYTSANVPQASGAMAGSLSTGTNVVLDSGGSSMWKDLWAGIKEPLGGGGYGGTSVLGSVTQGLVNTGGAMLAGSMGQDAAAEVAKENREANEKLQQQRIEAEERMLASQLASKESATGTEAEIYREKLAENRRQFDLDFEESRRQYERNRQDIEDRRLRSGSALAQARIARNDRAPGAPSIQQQVQQQREATQPGVPQLDPNGEIVYAS